MGWEVSTTTTPVARKEYPCDASEIVSIHDRGCGYMSIKHLRMVVKAKREGFKILPGTRYIKVCGLWDGIWQTFRGRLDMDDLCAKYDLYDEL